MEEKKAILESVSFSCPYCHQGIFPPFGILEESGDILMCSACRNKIDITGSSFADVFQAVEKHNGKPDKIVEFSQNKFFAKY